MLKITDEQIQIAGKEEYCVRKSNQCFAISEKVSDDDVDKNNKQFISVRGWRSYLKKNVSQKATFANTDNAHNL